MACNECGSRMVSDTGYICLRNNERMFFKQAWKAIILAILINGILIISSYNYVQYLAYKESIQIIKLENYKSEQLNLEQKNLQLQNMNSFGYKK